MKFKYSLLVLLSLLVVSACDREGDETREVTEEPTNQTQSIVPRDFTLNEVSIETDVDEIEINYINNEWEGTGLDQPHSQSISQFINELYLLSGVPSDLETEEEPDLTITLANNEENIEIEIWQNLSQPLIRKDGNYFEIAEWPHSLSPFDPIFLEEPLSFGLETLQEIVINDAGQEYIINQETTMNEVERVPFVSGWYVHGDFDTAFSAEYYWVEEVLTSFYTLRGYSTEETLVESGQRITLSDSESQEQIIIGQEVDKKFTLVELGDQNYLVPSQLLDVYDAGLLTMVDNFVALIPLDAVQTVDILTNEKDIHLSIDRTVESGEMKSSFFVNEKEIEEEVFRRTYQYLARLAYSERLEESDISQINIEDSEVTIHYTYTVDGEEVGKSIYLVPVENSDEYFVINEDIIEFKMTNDRLNEMLEAFLTL